MKRFFIIILLLIISLPSLAQTPQDRAELLTDKMDSLFSPLSLTLDQKNDLLTANIERYEAEAYFKQELLQDADYQTALANNFQSEQGQIILAEVIARKKEQERVHLQAVADVVIEQGYALYVPNRENLLQIVIDTYGD